MLTPEHYQKVFQQAHSAGSPHLTIIARANNLSHPRLGLAVPKKQIKLPSAVIDSNVFAEKAFAYIKINWLTKILLSSPKRARKI